MSATEPQDILKGLRRPFAADDVRIKLQTATVAVLYLDARLVIDRLNQVCGLDWHDDYTATTTGVLCKLTVAGTTRQDVGLAGDSPQGNSQKAILSDALKRAAVKFGVGISVYAAPVHRVTDADVWFKKDGKPGGLKDAAERRIRVDYARWLTTQGAHFGEPLAAGFEAGSAGDLVDADAASHGGSEPEERPTFIEPEVAPHPVAANSPIEAVAQMIKALKPAERKAVRLGAEHLGIPWNADTAFALHEMFGVSALTRDGLLIALDERVKQIPPVGEAEGEVPFGDPPSAEAFEEFLGEDKIKNAIDAANANQDAISERLAAKA